MVALVIIGGLLISGGTIRLQRALQNDFTVENHSGQPVALLMIGVYGSSSCSMVQDVPDGGKASAPFRIGGDGGFYIHGLLADGTGIKGGYYGYVTSGMYGEHARFVIKPGGGLDFSQGEDRPAYRTDGRNP
jgi:hypothetical protein